MKPVDISKSHKTCTFLKVALIFRRMVWLKNQASHAHFVEVFSFCYEWSCSHFYYRRSSFATISYPLWCPFLSVPSFLLFLPSVPSNQSNYLLPRLYRWLVFPKKYLCLPLIFAISHGKSLFKINN